MSAIDTALSWSGWAFSALGLAGTLFGLWLAWRERAKSERMAEAIGRVTMPAIPVHRPISPKEPAEEQLRALLIRAAADGKAIYIALDRASQQGVDEARMMKLAEDLKTKGLLKFSEPLERNTLINLNV